MIARLAKGVLPPNTQIQKDALLALHKSATVFVSYLASKYVACPFDTIKLEAPGPEPVRLDHEITCLSELTTSRHELTGIQLMGRSTIQSEENRAPAGCRSGAQRMRARRVPPTLRGRA